MKTIHKFGLGNMPGIVDLDLPSGAFVLTCDEQRDTLVVWIVVDTAVKTTQKIRFHKLYTGQSFEKIPGRFVGTAVLFDGATIVHVFQSRLVETMDGKLVEV